MSTAGSVPVFTGKKSLSLGDLDAMGNVVRDNAGVLRSAGRKGRAGFAHAGNAWYVPEPVPGLGESRDFTAEVPGLIAGAEFSGQFDRCIIEDGMLWLPHANIATSVDMETDEVTATAYAGGVHGIEARPGVEATLDAGVIVLPLAEYPDEAPDTTEGEEESPNLPPTAWPGLVQKLEFVAGLPHPCFLQGVGQIPLAHSPNSAVDANATAVAGGICGIRTNASISSPQIAHGIIEIPLYGVIDPGGGDVVVPVVPNAQFGPAVVDVPGMVGGMELVSGITEPEAQDGLIRFPLAHCPGAPNAVSGIAGAVYGAEYTTAISSPQIVNGLLSIPQPESPEYYSFDPEWFEVSEDGEVTIKQEALATVAEELAAEMSVEVTGTGVLEETYAGTLKANTAGTLTLNTNVTY